MATDSGHGSEKLWERLAGAAAPDVHEVAKSVLGADEEFIVRRWWKYGQPAIDLIRGVLDVQPAAAAGLIEKFVNLQGREIQVNLEIFPYGIVAPDLWRINVGLEGGIQDR